MTAVQKTNMHLKFCRPRRYTPSSTYTCLPTATGDHYTVL